MLDAKKLSDVTWVVIGGGMLGMMLLVFLASGLYWTYGSVILAMRGEKVIADCVSVNSQTSGSGKSKTWRTSYEVAFQRKDGKSHTTTISGLFSNVRQGQSVEVIYDPQNPDRAEANTFTAMWLIPLIFWTIVAVVTYSIWTGRKQRRLAGPARTMSGELAESD